MFLFFLFLSFPLFFFKALNDICQSSSYYCVICSTVTQLNIFLKKQPRKFKNLIERQIWNKVKWLTYVTTIDSVVRVPKGGVPGALEPWSPEISAVEPGALSFYWLEPWSFFGCGARSPKTFCAEPGAQHFQVWSFEFPDCIDSWLLPFCVCLCVLTGIKKQNLKRG